jgi:L-lactate dehydrogenase complex protein LldG
MAAGGRVHVVPTAETAAAVVLGLVRESAARRVLLGRGPVVDNLALESAMHAAGVQVRVTDAAGTPDRETLFQADVGISGVDFLIAETGSLVLSSAPDQPRSVSLLPLVHIAVAGREQLLPDLFDLFCRPAGERISLPSGLVLITGPSKTGDIELRLVTGVHGPGVVHVVLIDPAARR